MTSPDPTAEITELCLPKLTAPDVTDLCKRIEALEVDPRLSCTERLRLQRMAFVDTRHLQRVVHHWETVLLFRRNHD